MLLQCIVYKIIFFGVHCSLYNISKCLIYISVNCILSCSMIMYYVQQCLFNEKYASLKNMYTVHCTLYTVQVLGTVPIVTLDKTDSVQIYLSEHSKVNLEYLVSKFLMPFICNLCIFLYYSISWYFAIFYHFSIMHQEENSVNLKKISLRTY